MKKILTFLTFVFFLNFTYGQTGFGFDIGFATSKSALFDIKYFKNKNAFSLGLTYQFNDTKGKKVTEQLSNYGRTVDGTGNYFYTVDFGYTRILTDKFSLTGELSVGGRNLYTNYIDNRFTDGGYYMVDKSESLFGIGGLVTYYLNQNFGVFAGYNSIRSVAIGLQIKLLSQK